MMQGGGGGSLLGLVLFREQRHNIYYLQGSILPHTFLRKHYFKIFYNLSYLYFYSFKRGAKLCDEVYLESSVAVHCAKINASCWKESRSKNKVYSLDISE